ALPPGRGQYLPSNVDRSEEDPRNALSPCPDDAAPAARSSTPSTTPVRPSTAPFSWRRTPIPLPGTPAIRAPRGAPVFDPGRAPMEWMSEERERRCARNDVARGQAGQAGGARNRGRAGRAHRGQGDGRAGGRAGLERHALRLVEVHGSASTLLG